MAEGILKLFEDKLWQSSYLLISRIIAYVQGWLKREAIPHCRWVIFSWIDTSTYVFIKIVGRNVQCEKVWVQCWETTIRNKWIKKVNILEWIERHKREVQSVADSYYCGVTRNRWDEKTQYVGSF